MATSNEAKGKKLKSMARKGFMSPQDGFVNSGWIQDMVIDTYGQSFDMPPGLTGAALEQYFENNPKLSVKHRSQIATSLNTASAKTLKSGKKKFKIAGKIVTPKATTVINKGKSVTTYTHKKTKNTSK